MVSLHNKNQQCYLCIRILLHTGMLCENSLFCILGLITTLDLRPLSERKLPAILAAYLIATTVNLEATSNDTWIVLWIYTAHHSVLLTLHLTKQDTSRKLYWFLTTDPGSAEYHSIPQKGFTFSEVFFFFLQKVCIALQPRAV